MKIAIIGRTEILFNTAESLVDAGYTIPLVITAKEAPEYSKTASDFQQLARENNSEFLQTARISEALATLQELPRMDIAVSMNYPGIIPQEIIDFFPHGILNAHGGDLPRYQGNACQAWAILNGEEKIGLCIHKMVGGKLDWGDIIAREHLAIDCNTKITKCWEWMAERIPPMFLEAVEKLQHDSKYVLERQSPDAQDALRCYPRLPEDGRIDWQRPAVDVLRLINASNKPYAGAFCEFKSEKMIIWDAELVDDQENFCAGPGQVTFIGSGHIEVACQGGKLRLKVVEMGGQIGNPVGWVKSVRRRLE